MYPTDVVRALISTDPVQRLVRGCIVQDLIENGILYAQLNILFQGETYSKKIK